MKLSVSIVGCGRILNKHVEAIRSNDKYFTLDSISEINEKKLKVIKKLYNVNGYIDMVKMARERKPDLIIILTESGNHIKHAIKLSDYCQNFIIEKPLSICKKELKKLKLLKKNKIFVVNQNRFNPPIKLLKKIIDQKKLGKIFLLSAKVFWKRDDIYYKMDKWRGTKKLDGGVIGNQAAHFIDMLIWLNGKITSVQTKKIKINKYIEVEDTCVAIFKFKNGAIATLEATNATSPSDLEGSITVLGTKGTIKVGGFAMNRFEIFEINDAKKIKDYNSLNYQPSTVYGFGHKSFYEYIVNNFNNKKVIKKNLDISIETVKVIDKLLNSK